jgi:preprotein translocase subunit SecF
MSETTQRKRALIMAVVLAVVAIAFYIGFIWATANGY